MPDQTADNAHQEAPDGCPEVTAKDRRFREAIRRFQRSGEALIAERDRLQRLLEAPAAVHQPTDDDKAQAR